MEFEDLQLVNYCYPGCIPLLNIMRLPKDQAFDLAAKMAEEHPETTAFYRFGDFINYYELRKKQEAFMYERFIEKGGRPRVTHPLSFVMEGSEYLKEWFGNGQETRIALKDTDPAAVSFTVGDSGADYQRAGSVELLTWDEMKDLWRTYGQSVSRILFDQHKQYIEVQLWTETVSAVPVSQ